MAERSLPYVLCRVEDDGSTTPVSKHDDLLTGIAAGEYATEVEDLEFAYSLRSNGTQLAVFHEGRIGLREWMRRSGRLDYIHSVDDR